MEEDSPPGQHDELEYVISEDISKGANDTPVPCVSRDPNDAPPGRFTFVRTSHEVAGLIPGRPILSEGADGCRCEDDCSSLLCSCNQLSEGAAYYPWSGKLIESPYTTGRFDRLDIYECHPNCKCNKELCSNRESKRNRKWCFQVFKTLRKGWGLRTMQHIPAAFYVGEYAGEYVTLSKALRLDKTYAFNLQPRVDMVVDAAAFGNHFRFINHSCDPNLRTVIIFDHWDKRFPRICFFAIRDIRPLEELSIYYGTNFWFPKVAREHQVACDCGAPACLLKYTTPYRESPQQITMTDLFNMGQVIQQLPRNMPLSIQSFGLKANLPVSLRKRPKDCLSYKSSKEKKNRKKKERESGPRQAKRSQIEKVTPSTDPPTLIESPLNFKSTLDLDD